MTAKRKKHNKICIKISEYHLYILRRYVMIYTVALYPSQRPPVSKKGLKILLRAYR